MKKYLFGLAALTLLAMPLSATKHEFKTVPGDPLQTKMYTLPNGLKIFMTVNKDQPVSRPISPCAWAARTTRQKRRAWPTTSNT